MFKPKFHDEILLFLKYSQRTHTCVVYSKIWQSLIKWLIIIPVYIVLTNNNKFTNIWQNRRTHQIQLLYYKYHKLFILVVFQKENICWTLPKGIYCYDSMGTSILMGQFDQGLSYFGLNSICICLLWEYVINPYIFSWSFAWTIKRAAQYCTPNLWFSFLLTQSPLNIFKILKVYYGQIVWANKVSCASFSVHYLFCRLKIDIEPWKLNN